MNLPKTIAILSLLSLALLAVACGGGKSSISRLDSGKIPTATMPANLPEPLMIEGMPTRAVPQAAGDTYTVQSGDSLYAIAGRLGTTVDELKALNNLTSNDLSVGQVLRVPGGASQSGTSSPTPSTRATATPRTTGTPRATATPAPKTTPREGQTEYTVQSGDNANDIALRFGVTVEELAAANHTTVDNLRSLEVGQVLIIPAPSGTPAPQATEASPVEGSTPTPE